MEKLKADFIDQLRDLFAQSFYWACVGVFELPFRKSWISPSVHKPVCDLLQDYQKNTRVLEILPRGWLKSQITAVYYPVWRSMFDTEFTSITLTNTITNAIKKQVAKRAIIKSNPLLAQLYPDRMPDSSCQQGVEAFSLPRKTPTADATFESAGLGTTTTSRHCKLLVEDDTVAPEKDSMDQDIFEPSKVQCEKAIGVHKSVHFLLEDHTCQRVVAGTRWRQDDLIAYILNKEPQYKVIQRAVRELPDGSPSSNGLVVYPERFSEEALLDIESSVGSYMFNALMMNTPLSSSDMLFAESDLIDYSEPPKDLICYTTVDPAPSEAKTGDSDYNVVLTTGVSISNGRIYILDYFRERCTPGELIEAIFEHHRRYKPLEVGIESIGYQKTLKWWVQELQNKRRVWFNVTELKTSHRAKAARVKGLEPIIHSHRIFFLPWMTELKAEMLVYSASGSRGAHDDIVDALAYQIEFWQNTEDSIEEQVKHDTFDKFTAAHVLDELAGRTKRGKGFPFDVMGVTEDGKDVALMEPEEAQSCYPLAVDTGLGVSRETYV